jgi:hypothetical protein
MASQPLEECYVPGTLQNRLAPYALLVLASYSGGFPLLLLCIFHYFKDKIIADQVLRAHDKGDSVRTNRFYFLRMAFGKVYYMFRPKYYRWSITVILRKFALSVIFLMFNDDVTFQVASILGIVFVNFVLQVRYMPYMGVREKAVVIRQEAEERILSEIKRLERAQLLVRINGKSYYELMHRMRVEIDEQEKIMNKHKHDLFNLNTIETVLLGALVFLCLCAVMTNSKYLLERDYSSHSMVIVCVAIAIIGLTSLYFIVSVMHEIKSSSVKRKTRREMLWARVKSNSAKIRGMNARLLKSKKLAVLKTSTSVQPKTFVEKANQLGSATAVPKNLRRTAAGASKITPKPNPSVILGNDKVASKIEHEMPVEKEQKVTLSPSSSDASSILSSSDAEVFSSSEAESSTSGSDNDMKETLTSQLNTRHLDDDDVSEISASVGVSHISDEESDSISQSGSNGSGRSDASSRQQTSSDDAPSLFNH